MRKKTIPLFFLLIFYAIIGYSPYFGAVDQVGPQWLELTIINIITLIYFQLSSIDYAEDLKLSFKSPVQICLIIFCIWGLISYTYAINPNEVLIKSSQWINVVIAISIVFIIIKKLNFSFNKIALFVSLLLFIEVFTSIYQYIQLIQIRQYDFTLTNYIKGMTGNKNITSASIATKIPFLIYLVVKSENKFLRFITSVLLFTTYFNLILLSSRAIYISILAINLFIVLYLLISKRSNNYSKFINIKKGVLLLSIFLSSIIFSYVSLGTDNSAQITNRIQTINFQDTSTQQRIRYYKQAVTHFKNNLFVGVGLGSWKIKSIDYDSLNMQSYIVPYHVHNDFLEISTELGIIGLILFLSPFLIISNHFLRNFKSKFSFEIFIICLSLFIYFIDSNLNFPHARVINQIMFIIITASFLKFKTDEKL